VLDSKGKRALEDGKRVGFEGGRVKQWHDWYSLGRLIFECHSFVPPLAGANPPAGADTDREMRQRLLGLKAYKHRKSADTSNDYRTEDSLPLS
jgi:hypothetical protein